MKLSRLELAMCTAFATLLSQALPARAQDAAPAITAPQPLEIQSAAYPEAARRLGMTASVLLKLTIDATGTVIEAEVIESGGQAFDESARDALLRSRFTPATRDGRPLASSLAARTVWVDVAFAVVIATMTEGLTSPSYPFFAFAVLTAGLRFGMRQAMLVTTVNLVLYLCLIVVTMRRGADVYIMRPVYLGITGYLVGYLGQQSLELQARMRQLEIDAQRHRIARELHDGYAQALAGVNLRVETCRQLIRRGQGEQAFAELTELQVGVTREYDELRAVVRSLRGLETTPSLVVHRAATQFTVGAHFDASLPIVTTPLVAKIGPTRVEKSPTVTMASGPRSNSVPS
jgi:TonB family protein